MTSTGIEDPRDVVQFEIPDLALAVHLSSRLVKLWEVALEEHEDVNIVSVALRLDPEDFARLLRTVEAWVIEESLCAIRFAVDGREYVLAAGDADWAALPARAA